MRTDIAERLRRIPSVDVLLGNAALAGVGRTDAKDALDAVLGKLRRDILAGCAGDSPDACLDADGIAQAALSYHLSQPKFGRVINATGIILHTNLGRAPLAKAAARAAYDAAMSYVSLEMNPHTGARINRHEHIEPLLCRHTHAEAAMALNNNAAAILLAIATLKKPREILVSRGELVEIGGAFRVPDVLIAAGGRLVEVGTTNKTHLRDYAAAIHPKRTSAILRVSPSNFHMSGFVSRPNVDALWQLARDSGIMFIHDLGSGSLADVAAAAANADVVTFSADKELGGPQAGIAVGRGDFLAKMKTHPLARAFRLDKLSLAALIATLRLCEDPEVARMQIPAQRMICYPLDKMRRRANFLARKLAPTGGTVVRVVKLQALAGGGAQPGQNIASAGVAITHPTRSPEEIASAFRKCTPPIIGRIHRNQFIMDVRTIFKRDVDTIIKHFSEVGL